MNIGIKLKELRKIRKLKKKDVAFSLGISNSCYGGYEQGYREPDLDTLKKLCLFFDISADYLLDLEDYTGGTIVNSFNNSFNGNNNGNITIK